MKTLSRWILTVIVGLTCAGLAARAQDKPVKVKEKPTKEKKTAAAPLPDDPEQLKAMADKLQKVAAEKKAKVQEAMEDLKATDNQLREVLVALKKLQGSKKVKGAPPAKEGDLEKRLDKLLEEIMQIKKEMKQSKEPAPKLKKP